jgi:hypothetical protein
MRQILTKEDDLQSQAFVLEILIPKVHEKMRLLREFAGLELYKVYLKLVQQGFESNPEMAKEYLNKCIRLKKQFKLRETEELYSKIKQFKNYQKDATQTDVLGVVDE